MNKALVGVLLLASASSAGATGVDLSLSNETANLTVLLNPYGYAGVGSELGLGGFISEAGDNLLQASLMARGYHQSARSQYRLGAGLKAVYGELEIPEDVRIDGADTEQVGALGIGLEAGLLLAQSTNPVELVGEVFMAPSITSFTDAEQYLEFGARLQIDVIPTAKAYLGYRRLSFDTNDYDALRIDSGFHLGLKITF